MMYLLLRDNKQSGPYSLDDLKTKGLKAYDLVWVEGKSAAWRYPSEVGELSAFAPVVEEQPFDRFYKKPAATLTSTPLYSEDQSTTTRKRTIYVTMPGAAAAPVTVRESVLATPREPVREVRAEPVREVRAEPAREFVRPVVDADGELIPRPRPRNKPAIIQPVLIGVGILVLLASGIFIGLSINKDTSGLPKLASSTNNSQSSITPTTAQPLPVPPVVSPGATAPQVQQDDPTAVTQNRDHSGSATSPASISVASSTTPAIGKTGKTAASRQKAIMPGNQAVSPVSRTDSSATGLAVVHRETVHRADAADNSDAADKGSLKVSLASQVSVGANKYEVGTFGGISNLQVTVANKSAYPLDLVVVEVQYIQANKKTYKTENLYFHGVGPGMALMQEAPKSPRGVKVEYKITLINSKELGLSESGL